jgi:hypothetical protein
MEGQLFNQLNNEMESETVNDKKDYMAYAKSLIKVTKLV